MSAQIALRPEDSFSVQRESTGRAPWGSSYTAASGLTDAISIDSTSNLSIDSSAVWLPTTSTTHHRFTTRKGFLFGAVVVLHVIAAVVLSHFNTAITKRNDEPLQVVMLVDNHNEQLSTPRLPTPVLTLPEMALPLEPIIDVAEPAPQAITVVSVQQTAVDSSPATATPRLVSGVEYVHAPIVKYPSAARALKQHGTVMLRVLIDASGKPSEVQIQQSSGYRLLDEAALSAVLKALFKPRTENGSPVSVYAIVPIEFSAT